MTVPRLGEPIRSPADVLRGLLREIPDERGLVLVPHSNAGLYVAALADRRDVTGMVFVDAAVPDARPVTSTASPAFRQRLGELVDEDGLLPRWTDWWPEEDTGRLFPDEAVRRAVEREQRRLPLAYFDADLSTPAGWRSLPAAYLSFGDTYAEERDDARRGGWAAETLAGWHLHMLVDPAGVAAVLTRLVEALGRG